MTTTATRNLQEIATFIRRAGGVPNASFYRAARAARVMDAELAKPAPAGSTYRLVLANGREVNCFVPAGKNPLAHATAAGYEVVSYCKA